MTLDYFNRALEIKREKPEMTNEKITQQLNSEGYDVNTEALKRRMTRYKQKPKGKILIFNDLHIPFHLDAQIFEAIEEHRDEISAIVFGGDVLDCHAVSRFPKEEHIPIEEELIMALGFFKRVKEIVSPSVKLYLFFGNHEERWSRYIADKQGKDEALKFLNPRILYMLQDGFTLYQNKQKKEYEGIKDLVILDTWYMNINNELIIYHPDNYYKEPVKNIKAGIEHFIERGEKFNAVMGAHNHKQGEIRNHLNKWGAMTGCACKPMAYTEKHTNHGQQDRGYALIAFDELGKPSKNESKVFTWEVENEYSRKAQVKLDLGA